MENVACAYLYYIMNFIIVNIYISFIIFRAIFSLIFLVS
nr:MAG TPA: hypothetical protein [Caudoviricetes sp.]